MAARIVTTHYRYKRPPRKRKAVLLEVPAIVTPKSKAAPAIVQRDVTRGNDNHQEGPRIVQATKPKGRRKVWVDDGAETPPEILSAGGARQAGSGYNLPEQEPASQSRQSVCSKLQSAVRLSVFVCAHNEAANLGACLERLSFADEVVILLDRSTDGSAAIACALGDRVIEGVFPLEGPRRAAAQAACSGEWVLEVDADEHIPPALAREIRTRLDRGEPADWYSVPVDNYVGGRLIRCGWGGSFGTSAVARLYRRGAKSWGNERVHPTTHMAGRYGGRLSSSIDHWVDTDISDMLCRLDRYTAQHAADLLRLPKARHGLLSHLFRGIRRFWKCYVTRRGYREGDWGVLIALMAALYPMLSELRARLEVPGVLSETEPQPVATPTVEWRRD